MKRREKEEEDEREKEGVLIMGKAVVNEIQNGEVRPFSRQVNATGGQMLKGRICTEVRMEKNENSAKPRKEGQSSPQPFSRPFLSHTSRHLPRRHTSRTSQKH